MSDRENHSGESRLNRWSRLKTQARAERDVGAPPEAPAESAPGPQAPESGGDGAAESNHAVADLPDIETLDKDSDFTPFLGVGVPDELRRLALKKLWASDPVLANLDGLNDYDEDFSALGMIAAEVASVFKPGAGLLDPERDRSPADPAQPQQEEAAAQDGSDAAADAEARKPGPTDAETDDPDAPDGAGGAEPTA